MHFTNSLSPLLGAVSCIRSFPQEKSGVGEQQTSTARLPSKAQTLEKQQQRRVKPLHNLQGVPEGCTTLGWAPGVLSAVP